MCAKNNDAHSFFDQVNHVGPVREFTVRTNGHDIDGGAGGRDGGTVSARAAEARQGSCGFRVLY